MALYPGGGGGGHGGHGGGQRRPPPYPPIRDSWIHEVDSEVKFKFSEKVMKFGAIFLMVLGLLSFGFERSERKFKPKSGLISKSFYLGLKS